MKENRMQIKSAALDLSLSKKKCNEKQFDQLKAKIEKSIKQLEPNFESSKAFIEINKTRTFLNPKKEFDLFLIKLVEVFKISKIEESLNCN